MMTNLIIFVFIPIFKVRTNCFSDLQNTGSVISNVTMVDRTNAQSLVTETKQGREFHISYLQYISEVGYSLSNRHEIVLTPTEAQD